MRMTPKPSLFRSVGFGVISIAAFVLACAVRTPESVARSSQATDTFFEFQVDNPVVLREGAPPGYPVELKSAGIGGEVRAQFVVDETGLVNMSTFKVLMSPDPGLTAAVKAAVSTWRVEPAIKQGRKVKQLVQQSFVFRPPPSA
jgi:protein TonB